MWKSLLLILCLLFPAVSEAAVSINEVAWMGSSESSSHEWIELYNDGNEVDVTGWTLSDGQNLTINLVGTIPANSFVVLERTSEASSPAEALVIYTGALVNTGATLSLLRADGSQADVVSGGEDWQNIGGDNTTKETAQYTQSGWITAEATAGQTNRLKSTSSTEDDKKETGYAVQTKTSSAPGGRVAAPANRTGEKNKELQSDSELKLSISAPLVGYVNQEISFTPAPSGIGKTLISSLQYEWNFGDGFAVSGKTPKHVFSYPGTYVVNTFASYKQKEQTARQEITILPISVSLTQNKNGDVQVNNDSPYEIDLSGFKLSGEKSFVFPDRTILLNSQTITIPQEKLIGKERNITLFILYDEQGEVVTKREEEVVVFLETFSDEQEGTEMNPLKPIPLPLVSAPLYVEEYIEPVAVVNRKESINSPSDKMRFGFASTLAAADFSSSTLSQVATSTATTTTPSEPQPSPQTTEKFEDTTLLDDSVTSTNKSLPSMTTKNSNGYNWPYYVLALVLLMGILGVLTILHRDK